MSSSDCGVSWGDWETIYTLSTTTAEGNIAIGMNDDGDIGLITNLGYTPVLTLPTYNSISATRKDGVWVVGGLKAITTTAKQLFWDDSLGWYIFTPGKLFGITGTNVIVDTTPSKTSFAELLQIMESEVDYTYYDPIRPYPSHRRRDKRQEVIQVTTVQETISESDLVVQLDVNHFVLLNEMTCYYITKDGLDKLTKSVHAYTNTIRACVLSSSASYIFQINDHTIYFGPHPGGWAPPVIGTGAGDSLEIAMSRILDITENVPLYGTIAGRSGLFSSLDIYLDNSEGYFDSPGAGDLVVLEKGSRISYYLGFNIAGTEYYVEHARYFVDSWEYSRHGGFETFVIHCVDAWKLLNDYTFPLPAEFNVIHEEGVENNEYNVYELMGMVIEAIGGTLTYEIRSDFILSYYPQFKINMGETAASVLGRLKAMVLDEIKFFGNDATILYPQSTDSEVYEYKFEN